jgi:hypothetical protein
MHLKEWRGVYGAWHAFLKAQGIKEVILRNWDNGEMGCVQLIKVIDTEEMGKCLVLTFSSSGEKLCACCGMKEQDAKPN